jgi:hypothetical protein
MGKALVPWLMPLGILVGLLLIVVSNVIIGVLWMWLQ